MRKRDTGKLKCQKYRLRGQREFNKAERLRKHLTRFPADRVAVTAIRALGVKHA